VDCPQRRIGERVRERRDQLGWTQSELAQRAGVHPSWISRIESGIAPNVSAETVLKLARALAVSVDHLMGRFDTEVGATDVDVLEGVTTSADDGAFG